MKRTLASILLVTALLCLASSCRKQNPASRTEGTIADYTFTETLEQTNHVKIEMTDGSLILLELYPDIAPITVQNFKDLVTLQFYDGVIFHRVISGFMIQGGDPDGDGHGGSNKTIKGEFAANGVENNLKHTRGVLSMARTGQSYDSASSQFFIMHAAASHLDGQYAAFGKVIAGMEVVDRIASTPVNSQHRPLEPQTMKTVRFVILESATAGQDTTVS